MASLRSVMALSCSPDRFQTTPRLRKAFEFFGSRRSASSQSTIAFAYSFITFQVEARPRYSETCSGCFRIISVSNGAA